MVSPELGLQIEPDGAPANPGRWFIGIGVGQYDDAALNLRMALGDVDRMSIWFTRDSRVDHRIALRELASNPTWAQISSQLRNFLNQRVPDDVVVIYIACHGEQEAGEAYLFGRDTPRANLAGCAVSARQLGLMLGASKPHNVLVIVDACVAGTIAAAIADATRLAVREQNTRDPYRRFAQVMIASTFGLDPAQDGQFVEAFLRTISNERWTGTARPWISLEQLIQGLNEELREKAPGQRVECTHWFNGEIQLIPNPNVGRRQHGGLFDDKEFAAHFDPASRGVSRSETGYFFTGRTTELARASQWLNMPKAVDAGSSPMFVITGSPGTGKSALLSRIAVLSQPDLLPPGTDLARLPPETVPRPNALDGVIWCHGKTRRQVIGDLARVLDGTASTPDALFGLAEAHGRGKVIAVDALDEAAADEAEAIAREVLAPLVSKSSVRLMIATRKHAIGGGGANLLDELAVPRRELLDLDLSTNHRADLIRYVEARLEARGFAASRKEGDAAANVGALAQAIAMAAGKSFLVASIAVRSAQPHQVGAYHLPAEVGEALAGYLDRLPEPERIRDVLRPLAWALGPGLPWGTIWPALATALADDAKAVDDEAIGAALDAAGDLIVESDDGGEPVYRLFHEALAEHLRSMTTRRAEAPGLIGRALLALRTERRWSDVPRYARTYLPAFLTNAEMLDELSAILLDPAWARLRRIDSGDPLSTAHDVEAAAASFLKYRRPLDLAPLCHQHSRDMTETVPPLIEVLALSGQSRRAEVLAANLTDVADRMLVYRALAQIYATDQDPDGARRCADEVERALPAMHADHRPMAWCWTAQAAMAAGLPERARRCAIKAFEAVALNDEWDRLNGLFWAAMASRLTDHADTRMRVRAELEQGIGVVPTFRNQFLQAAAIAGCTAFLRQQLEGVLALAPGQHSTVRIGNLALALADAGLLDEMTRLVNHVGNSIPSGEPDSVKRWTWALAISGRLAAAVDALALIGNGVECSKAIGQIADIIARSGDTALIERLNIEIKRFIPCEEPRTEARLIRAMWTIGQREAALAEAERAMAASGRVSAMIDPRVEERSNPTGVRNKAGRKTARRAMVTSRAPVVDQINCGIVETAASKGDLASAREIVAKIEVPQFKAEALGAIALHDPDVEAGIDSWMEALIAARRAGRGAVALRLPSGIELLQKAGRPAEALALEHRIVDIDAAWQLELFIGEYASLRTSVAAGGERTRIFENLLLVPMHLARMRTWSKAEVRAAWDRGEDGSRLFAVGLMRGDPALVVSDLLAEGIRASRSAFEQGQALQAVADAQAKVGVAETVLRAISDEMSGLPRPGGSRAWLDGPNRYRLAKQILERHEKR